MSDTIEKRPNGRPTIYTEELGQRFAELYANGMKMHDIFAQDWAPACYMTIVEWQEKYPNFDTAMSRARASHAEFLVDTMADAIKDNIDPQKARLAIQVRQWTASKWSQRYADRVQLEVDHKVSIGAALEAGMQRLAMPVRDQPNATNSQAIEDASFSEVTTTDDGSVAAPDLPDWMD